MVHRLLRVSAGILTGLTAAGVFLLSRGGPAPGADPLDGRLIPAPFPAPALALTTADGSPWTLAQEGGSVVAVFFGYTYCPDVCPLTLARLGQVQEERRSRGADAPPFRIVFVSVDPDRDTPERLRAYTDGLPGEILAVTGQDVRSQAFDFGVRVADQPTADGSAGGYLVDHTARTFLVDPRGRVTATLPAMVPGDEAAAVLEAVYERLE